MTNMPSIPFRTCAAIIPSLVPGPRWMVYYFASAFVQAWIWSTHVINAVFSYVSIWTKTRGQRIFYAYSSIMTRIHEADISLMTVSSMILRLTQTAWGTIYGFTACAMLARVRPTSISIFTAIPLVTVLTHAFIALKSLNACTSMFTRVRGAKGSVFTVIACETSKACAFITIANL